jgi:hypothetical protein
MIKAIWEMGNPKLSLTTDARVAEILRVLEAQKSN